MINAAEKREKELLVCVVKVEINFCPVVDYKMSVYISVFAFCFFLKKSNRLRQ